MSTKFTWIVWLAFCVTFNHGLKAQQSLSLVIIFTGLSSPLVAGSWFYVRRRKGLAGATLSSRLCYESTILRLLNGQRRGLSNSG